MNIPINLASQPFRRDRPILMASAVLAIVLMGLLGALISIDVMQSNQQKDARQTIAQLDRQVQRLTTEQNRLDAVLRKPENAEVLERTIFLNSLLYRKGISWTRMLADLEKTLPHNVRLVSVRPSANAQNQITLDMVVAAESPEPVIELLKKLEMSPLFGAAYLHSTLPPSQNEPMYRSRVSVNYAQSL